ncbi:MAG: class I SAM-dependent methyltransferase [Planctomycetaceae bacterium]|nr:class I SAM-dependent methyltransferase [Planctomycetaceae bacterium]
MRGDDRNLLWQKERLLNLLIDQVPDDVDAIAWIDADILFTNPDWPAETLKALEEHAIVQLFDTAEHLMPDGSITPIKRSCGWHYVHDRKRFTHFGIAHPGFAWAGRADWLRRHKLLDTIISGGGDIMIMKAITREAIQHEHKITGGWRRQLDEWASAAQADVEGSFGCVPGVIRHLYHGSMKNRRYLERWRYLTDHHYDPTRHLEIDAQGLYRWTEAAPKRMVRQLAQYFALRREDAPPERHASEPVPEFTTDWFSMRIPQWERHLRPLMGQPVQCLEIGSYEGRSAIWLMQRVCTHRRSRLTCVDSWAGDWASAEHRFTHNLAPHRQRLKKLRAHSHTALRRMERESLDFVYVDGSHEGRDVLEDCVLAWRLLKPGGLMCCDDYEWDGEGEPAKDVMPKVAIDAFVAVYGPSVEVVERGYQLWLRKLTPSEPIPDVP